MIYIASDHGGFKLKEDIKKFLIKQKVKFTDLGPAKFVQTDDYPVYARKVTDAVKKDLKNNLGILICRSGQGVCIAANRVKGIHATLCWNENLAKHARREDDSNVLCLAADYVSTEMSEDIVKVWLDTSFSNEERHIRRLKELEK